MSDELKGLEPLVLRPPTLGEDVDAVGPTQTGAFAVTPSPRAWSTRR